MESLIIVLAILINISLIGLTFYIHFDDSNSLGIIYIIITAILINLFLGIIFRIFRSEHSLIFFPINAIISSIVVFISMLLSLKYYDKVDLKGKSFSSNETYYIIYFYNSRKEYDITNSTDSGNKVLGGKFYKKNEKIYLNEEIYISNDSIFNFPVRDNKIKLDDL